MPSPACRTRTPGKTRPRWEVADILRLHGRQYIQNHHPPISHLRAMRLLEICRTARLGGHLEQCDNCGYERPSYNSCRNRHCPKCQTLTKEKWLEDRRCELIPAKYFHTVFTLPHELNPLTLVNKDALFKILFRSISETLQAFAKDPRWKLQGQLGFTAVLHTWSQTLLDHFHIHCVIPAGVLSLDRQRWIAAPDETFLFPVKPLSKAFRGKFLFNLKQAYRNRELIFPGRIAPLQSSPNFYRLLRQLYQKDWVVYSKRPFAGPEQVLEYIARYTHRVAISNNRIVSVKDGNVTFKYKDRSDESQKKVMTLPADEFIRRFLLHVLPNGFMRIRHFGFLANVSKKHSIPLIRQCLGQSPRLAERTELSTREMMIRLTGIDIFRCPRCQTGNMSVVVQLPRMNCNHDPPLVCAS